MQPLKFASTGSAFDADLLVGMNRLDTPARGNRHKVRFISAADLMLQLAAAKSQGRLKEYFDRAVLGPKLLVVDEIGYQRDRQCPSGSDLLRRSSGKVGQI